MEKLPSTMVLHKNIDGGNTIFSTMSVPLANNHVVKWLVLIRRGAYQAVSKDSRWAYEPVSYLWPDIDPDSDFSSVGSNDEGIKDQEKPDYQEHEEMVSVPHRNPRDDQTG